LPIYKLFIEIIGDLPLNEIDDDVALTYVETLKKLPANMNKIPAYSGKTIAEIGELEQAADALNAFVDRACGSWWWVERAFEAKVWTKLQPVQRPKPGFAMLSACVRKDKIAHSPLPCENLGANLKIEVGIETFVFHPISDIRIYYRVRPKADIKVLGRWT
jgi:hypothetical protein